MFALTVNAVLLSKGHELAVGPGVPGPVAHVARLLDDIVVGLVPACLGLVDQLSNSLLRGVLDSLSLGLEVVEQLGGIPLVVGLNNVVVPVLLDEVLDVLAVSGGRIRDAVVGEPTLELSLMPLVVD